ncbi:MAG: hypothetical protein K9L66_06465 [Spirochaetaceae bacterium]|nr:hypothetical protein [Spirochaetaceae bacterium]MCF7949487.1 hypothetical protein [Spirochaetia bacterium]MCF7951187.1 hypothetical protein [Spirochaetaceae bacterium]
MKRKTAVQLVILAAVTISIGLKVIWTLPYQAEGSWKGYQVALVAEAPAASPVPIAEVKQALQHAGFYRILSSEDQEVALFQYSGISTFPLSALSDMLEPQDPRYDPYLKALPRYFEGSIDGHSAQVLYMQRDPSQLPPLFLAEKLRRQFNTPVYISGLEPLRQVILWGFIGSAILIIGALFRRKYRIRGSLLVYSLGALGALPGIVHMNLSTFTWWLLQLIAWTLLLAWIGPAMKRRLNAQEESFFSELRKYSAVYFAFNLAGIAVAALGGEQSLLVNYAGHSLLTMCIQGGLLYGLFILHRRLARQQLHSLFIPIHITQGSRLGSTGFNTGGRQLRWPAVAALLFLGVLPVVILPALSVLLSREVEYPMPSSQSVAAAKDSPRTSSSTGTAVENFSWQELLAFDRSVSSSASSSASADRSLPNFADYLRHRAFQEGYFYGRSYTFPVPGEQISITTYTQEGVEVLSKNKVVKMFTDEWYKDIITSAKNSGVPQLLLEQKQPVQVKIEKSEPFRIHTNRILGHIGIMLMVLPAMSLIASRKVKSKRVLTEKQQQKKGQKVA